MPASNKDGKYTHMVRQFKTYIVTEELIKHKYCISKTAKSLGMHRNSLSRIIDELEIEIKRGGKSGTIKPIGVVAINEANTERSLPVDR